MEEDYWDGGSFSEPVKKVQNYDSYQSMFPELSWSKIKLIVDKNSNEKHERIVEILERERVRNTPSSGDDALSNQLLSLMGTPDLVKSASSCQSVGSDYKTVKCEKERCDDPRCSKYHSGVEKRRNQNSFKYGKEACAEVFRNGKWMDPSLCMKGDLCGNAHSRNEVDYYDDSARSISLSAFRGSSDYTQRIENQMSGIDRDSTYRNPMIKFIESAGPPKMNFSSFQEPSLRPPYPDLPRSIPSSSLSTPPTISPLPSNLPEKNVPKFNPPSSQPPNPIPKPVSGPIITNSPSVPIPQITNPSHSKPDVLSTFHQFLGKNFLIEQNTEKLEIALKLLKSKLEILQQELSESHHNQVSLNKECSLLLPLSSCPLCSSTNRDGVYYCGHSLCKSCKFKYQTCPICN